jgi:hypothetical protein
MKHSKTSAIIRGRKRSRLKLLDKKIRRLFWEIEKLQELSDDGGKNNNEDKLNTLSKQLRGDLYSYDMIVKRLIDLKQKTPESEQEEVEGWKKEITGLIKWGREQEEKHELMVRKVTKSHGITKKTSLLADFIVNKTAYTIGQSVIG